MVSLPLDFRFYMMKKLVPFDSKMDQAAAMLKGVFDFYKIPVLVITDSWFGNNGFWSRLEQGCNGDFHLLSRLRTIITLYKQLL